MSVNEAHAEVLDRLPAGFAGDQTTGLRRHFYALWQWLPKGQLLPEHIWRRRHAAIVWLPGLPRPGAVRVRAVSGADGAAHASGVRADRRRGMVRRLGEVHHRAARRGRVVRPD